MRRRIVTVNDRMQRGYRYELVAPIGRGFDPEFRPELTPRDMLRLGVFAGKYMTDCRREFPASWFEGAKLATGDMGGVGYTGNQFSGTVLSHDGATLVTCNSFSDPITIIKWKEVYEALEKNDRRKLRGVRDLDRRMLLDESFCNLREILHVRTEDDRLAVDGGLIHLLWH